MSSTLSTGVVSPNDPITIDSVREAFAKLGVEPKEQDVDDYKSMLTGVWEVWNKVDQMGDYVPAVDEDRFPRKDVHRPEGDENKWNAWAWKATVKDSSASEGKGLLAGKTICLKDNVALKGVPCLLGTNIFSDWNPNTDATLVTRLLEAGATITGKAVCENLSLWAVSTSAATGSMENVWAPGFSAGGSSSGCGVLLGRGEVDMAIGGDQGGSIRIPSAVNGLVGLKPTTGLVPYTGIASLESVVDSTGPMTRSVMDNAALLQAIAGADGIDDRQQAGCPFPGQVPDYPSLAKQGVQGLKIGILTEAFATPLSDKRVSDLVVKAATALKDLGAVVEEVSVPMHTEGPNLWAVVGQLSAASGFLGKSSGRRQLYLNDLTEKFLPLTQEKADKMFCSGMSMLVNGTWGWEHLPPALFGKATNLVRKLRDEYYAALDKYDVLVLPTMPFLAQKLPPAGASVKELMKNSAGTSLNTSAFNLTGLPALTMPVGFLTHPIEESAKLPVGMQLVGKFYSEPTLYRVAYAWEQANDWKTYQ